MLIFLVKLHEAYQILKILETTVVYVKKISGNIIIGILQPMIK